MPQQIVEEFVSVMAANVVGARKEAGCLHFDLLQDGPTKFITYEVFKSRDALDAHMEQPYLKAWGRFQYGDKHPIVEKRVIKANALVYAGSKPSCYLDYSK